MGVIITLDKYSSVNIYEYIKIIQERVQGVMKLDDNQDLDVQNKKLSNLEDGTDDDDAMNRKQIVEFVNQKSELLNHSLPAQVANNKAVIYSNSGSIHANALYLKDQYGQEVHFFTENQQDNQIRLYIPNLKNFDSYGERLKSSIIVSSIIKLSTVRRHSEILKYLYQQMKIKLLIKNTPILW